jgi:hypothetical protein
MGLPKPLISLSAAHGRVARLTSKTRERDNAAAADLEEPLALADKTNIQ